MQKRTDSFILASGSPRRRELLRMICEEFRIIVPDCEETVTGTEPEEVTKELSRQKAEAVAHAENRGEFSHAVIIGADTVVR